jgi:hypothetical protein
MGMWDFYKDIWSHIGGRPWTYILRDAWYKIEGLWIIGLVGVGVLLGHWWWHITPRLLLAFALGYICGHLFWGKDYIPDQRVEGAEKTK